MTLLVARICPSSNCSPAPARWPGSAAGSRRWPRAAARGVRRAAAGGFHVPKTELDSWRDTAESAGAVLGEAAYRDAYDDGTRLPLEEATALLLG
ncbi:hypothetical protein NKH77_15180 [Streptomyces sp. M19]